MNKGWTFFSKSSLWRGVNMKTSLHLKRHEDKYFHLHAWHSLFSLVATFVLAVLMVLVLVTSAH